MCIVFLFFPHFVWGTEYVWVHLLEFFFVSIVRKERKDANVIIVAERGFLWEYCSCV